MRTLFSIVTIIVFSDCLLGSVIVPSEFGRVRGVGIQIQVYSVLNEGQFPTSWSDFIDFDPDNKSLIEFVNRGETPISENYSFISKEDRAKFPEGELLLIRYTPTGWPESWKHETPAIDPSEMTEEQRAEFKRLADREQPIRYLVYRNERGDLDSVWWFEKDVQKMLAETGIRVPEPEPYQVTAVAETPDSPPVPEAEEITRESTAAEPSTEKLAEVKTPDTTEEPAEQSSNWWLWLIGALVVVGGIALVVRRKS